MFPLGRLLQFLNRISNSSKALGIYLGHCACNETICDFQAKQKLLYGGEHFCHIN